MFFGAAGVSGLHGSQVASVGVAWPWAWKRMSQLGQWTGATEAFVSHWHVRSRWVPGTEAYTQVGAAPVLRLRFDQGRSPWFVEGGIGVSWFDSVYESPRRLFSSRFQFYDALGVGRSFGPAREHELSLRFHHISNAGIKKPNPGENLLQLRYSRAL